jgi:carbon storage regulator
MEDSNMLVLSRKPGEQIHIGPAITVTVVEIDGNRIKLGIDAPETVRIFRAELNAFLGQLGTESLAPQSGRSMVSSL